ncbi:MAG: hypothetical protein ACOYEV_02415 [Candidatus Nanopelagicales bacterium]
MGISANGGRRRLLTVRGWRVTRLIAGPPVNPPGSLLTRPHHWHPTEAYLLVGLISALVVSRWFRAGTFIATGDMGPFLRRGWAPEVLWTWSHQTTGAGSATYTLARWPEFLIIRLAATIGYGETYAQWAFYTLIYGFVGVSAAYAAAGIVRSRVALVFAGSFAVLNGFFLTRLPNPLNIISVGVICLTAGIALRVGAGARIPAPVAGFALLPTSFLAFNPPMLVVAYAWASAGVLALVTLLQGRRAFWRLLGWLARGAPWAVLMNAFWLVPLAASFTGGGGATTNAAFTDPTTWSWSQINNTVPNVLTLVANWAWYLEQYLPFTGGLDRPGWLWVRYLLPTAVILAPVFARRPRQRAALGLLGIVWLVVLLAKGLKDPLPGLNLWLYLHIPGFWLFREPMSKLGQLLVLCFALLLAILAESIHARMLARESISGLGASLRARRWGALLHPAVLGAGLSMAALVAILAYPYPLFTGAVMPDTRPTQPSAHVRVPAFWRELAQTIDANPDPGKVLVLPLDDYYQMPTTWGFFGVDSIANLLVQHPVLSPKPDGYFGEVAGLKAHLTAIQTALLSGDLAAVPRLLDAAGATQVIVRHDLVRGLPGRAFADDRVLAVAMDRVTGMTHVQSGTLDLWAVADHEPGQVRAYQRVLRTANNSDGGAAVLGSIGSGTATVSQGKSTDATGTSTTSVGVPQVSAEAATWQVPASGDGTASTTIDVTGGDYTVAQRARAAAVLTPRIVGDTLLLRDEARIRVDDVELPVRADTEVALPAGQGARAEAVQVGTRTVSLDGFGRSSLPTESGIVGEQATVPVGVAAELTVYSLSSRPVRTTRFSQVYDCDNYEPRPWAELGLTKSQTSEGTIRLSAKDHAACTRLVLTNTKPGRHYRIRLQYRMVAGRRPQICVWQVGLDGCELTSRATTSQTWADYEKFITVADNADEVQLVLHADVGERLWGQTITDYRAIEIVALDEVAAATIWPETPTDTTVHLSPGKHRITATAANPGSILADFEGLADCFRYDERNQAETELLGEVDGVGVKATYTLGARFHMACLGATAPDMGGSSLYEFSLQAKSVKVRDPKFCLFLRGPDMCQKLPAGGPWKEWTDYITEVSPNPDAVETRVYLYGLQDLSGKQQSQVQYREVALRPVVTATTVVLVKQDAGGATALAAPRQHDPQYDRLSPASFHAEAPRVAMLALTETYAPGWHANQPTAKHVVAQGWMNAWMQVPVGQLRMTYLPAYTARKALFVSVPSAGLGLVWCLLVTWWRRRRPT